MSITNSKSRFYISLIALVSLILQACNSAVPEETTVTNEPIQTAPARAITVFDVTKNSKSYLEVNGTVKSQNQTQIYPVAPGQIKSIRVKEGEKVRKGQLLFEITGANNTTHPLLDQLTIAQINLNSAINGYNQTLDGNNSALNIAELQLQSAQNQLDGAEIDLESLDDSIDTTEENIDLLYDLLDLTEDQNEDTEDQLDDLIDDLQDLENELQDQQTDLEQKLTELETSTLPEPEKTQNIQEVQTALNGVNAQLKEISVQLNTAEKSESGAELGGTTAENRLRMEINQYEGQVEGYENTIDSTIVKLGLNRRGANGVNMAWQNVLATRIRNNASLVQIESQVQLARINVSMIQNQIKGLIITAPIDGVVGTIDFNEGDTVGPQSQLTEIVNTNNYELKIAVDTTSAAKINANIPAEIKIGERYIKAPIKSISIIADPITKLVPVTIALPQAKDTAINQNVKARLTLNNFSPIANTFYIPLDAVIIGTEEQYVYVLEEGQAKRRTIKVGEINNDTIEIKDGIKEGEQVILEGAKNLVENEEVRIGTNVQR
ncbi:MAG: efflux RND transporter periplasmic adaptor subunit [Patescibacteria group bacterium]